MIYIPDGTEENKAIGRTTHLAISAHQDDIEFMAYAPIAECFGKADKWFSGVVVTDGAGSPRSGLYADYTDEKMKEVRIAEQKKAAVVGEYSFQMLLGHPSKEVKDPRNTAIVKELAEKYNVDVMTMVGFLDGINDSLKVPNPIEEMEEDTEVNLGYDLETLYKNMVDAKADWLYELPQWNNIFSEEKRKELYKEQKKSGTVVKGPKIGRNDPCPCGSGKKYKYCCGRNK